jgi:CTP:molybdopterin cytidylyltransferase MocA
VRPLLALVADAIASDEGAYGPHPDTFVSGALRSLANELELMHQALTYGSDAVVIVAADMPWRLAERPRAVAEISARIREVHD